jgi:tRNA modification GTPase
MAMDDTIAAISTSPSVGAISIVRVSGKDAVSIVNKITDIDLKNVQSHSISYAHIINKDEVIDEVLLMTMLAPKTYTTEDTIEINCHGGFSTTRKVLELLLSSGARLAEPGEFTKRAFLNGRINLLEAESVNDLITAKTDAARTMAINNVDGILTKIIHSIREKIAKILANIEVNIDYPEYTDELEVTTDLMHEYLGDITKELNELVKGSKNGRLIKEGVTVAIIGKPNVGKSSILNHLIDEEKAIVTDIPGTTRDIVEGSISLNGVEVNFIDTAGIRETKDTVEKLGVQKSKKTADNSDLVLLVLNNNEKLTKEEKEMLDIYNKDNVIVFVNKSDLDTKLELDRPYITGNTKDLNGLDSLKEEIVKKLELDSIVNKDMSYLSNVRQIDLINKANESIKNANKSLNAGMSVDMIEIDLKSAWEYLGEITGESYKDELVDKIFSNFCLGK